MEVSQIGIGNYYNGGVELTGSLQARVSATETKDFVLTEKHFQAIVGYTNWYKLINPIPLTDKWFEYFGFRKNVSWFIVFGRFKDRTLELALNNDTSEVQYYVYVRGFLENEFVAIRHDLKYVHELQDLFRAVSGTELTLK